MANTLAGDVWFVDTAGTLVAAGTPVNVWSFLFTCATAVTATRVQVTDSAGRTVFVHACNAFIPYTQPINMDGLIVPVISGGTLLIQVG